MDFETIELERRGPVAILTLNRPDRLNAMNPRMLDELDLALDQVAGDDQARALVLRGAGRAFCAGFDLKESLQQEKKGVADWRPILERDLDVIMRFWRLPKPTIAAVHGYALAGGCELALACDMTIAAEGTRMGEPELKFGAGIVAMLLPWFANPKRAKEILLTGNDRVDAAEALEIGMINRVVPHDALLETAMGLAQEICVMDPAVVRMTKEAINRTYDIMGMSRALEMAVDMDVLIESMETPERKTFGQIARDKGLKAAVEWRDSRFKTDSQD